MMKMNLFQHVTKDHEFKNEYLFYRLKVHENHGYFIYI